jgi:hypothetical protein
VLGGPPLGSEVKEADATAVDAALGYLQAVAEHVLAEREPAAATAARLSPSRLRQAGAGGETERSDEGPHLGQGGAGIEGYRVRNGVVRDTASSGRSRRIVPRRMSSGGSRAAAARTAPTGVEEAALHRAFDVSWDWPMTQQAEGRPTIGSLTEPLPNADEAPHCSTFPVAPSTSWSARATCRLFASGEDSGFTRAGLARWIRDNTSE